MFNILVQLSVTVGVVFAWYVHLFCYLEYCDFKSIKANLISSVNSCHVYILNKRGAMRNVLFQTA